MDDLVLLAQMHGEGPETVKALRANGVQTAADVAALEPEELGRLVGLKPGAARKMCEEARRMVGEASASTEEEEEVAIVPDETPRGKPAAITARANPRKRLSNLMAATKSADACGSEPGVRAISEAESEEGVDPAEAAMLGEARRSAARDPNAPDRAPAFVSFWRFG